MKSVYYLLLFVFLCETAQSQSQANNFPFPVGEKLSFRVSWSNTIDAGSADLTVGQANSTGNDLLRIQLKALTSPNLSNNYSFKDEFVSYFDLGLSAPRSFQKNFTERKRVVDEKMEFDQVNRHVVVTQSKKIARKFSIETGTQDPISSLYAMRIVTLRPGMTLSFPVMDGERTYRLDARVTGQELITTKLGNFNSHRTEIHIRPVDSSSSERTIVVWFSSDQRRLPVLAMVSLPVGSAVIELVSRTP
jgi:hypothetical protein